jgi:Arc/MetJ-type ribon-helix-helix transcriptional regulator
MPSSYNLPEIVKKEIDALVSAGYYSSKSDVVKDALRTFLDKKKNMRIAAAVELYKREEVSLGKAAEIADMGILEFKERLAELGYTRVLKTETARKMDKELAKIQRKYG